MHENPFLVSDFARVLGNLLQSGMATEILSADGYPDVERVVATEEPIVPGSAQRHECLMITMEDGSAFRVAISRASWPRKPS
jgi:hypothetical protein